jgi:hypothetical protein
MDGLDENVKKVVGKYIARAKMGKAKYGVDTTREDFDFFTWLVHLQEELMDATIYIERIKSDIVKSDKVEIKE